MSSASLVLLAFSALLSQASAHSWPERAINVGPDHFTPVGAPGFLRNSAARGAGFQDGLMSNRIIVANEQTPFCMTKGVANALSDQTQQTQTANFPRLQTSKGSEVAIQYLENGHVSQPQQPNGHADNSGTLMVFGSATETNPLLSDVLAWNADGTSGNGKGKLLKRADFDDRRCYQAGSTADRIQPRKTQYPVDPANPPIPGIGDMPCQINFEIPVDAETGKPYSIYWFWDWTMLDSVNNPNHKEYYTGCMDFDIVDSAPHKRAERGPMSPTMLHQRVASE